MENALICESELADHQLKTGLPFQIFKILSKKQIQKSFKMKKLLLVALMCLVNALSDAQGITATASVFLPGYNDVYVPGDLLLSKWQLYGDTVTSVVLMETSDSTQWVIATGLLFDSNRYVVPTNIAGHLLGGEYRLVFHGSRSNSLSNPFTINPDSGLLRPRFGMSKSVICKHGRINFTNLSNVDSDATYTWYFPGGTPSTFVGANPPMIDYSSSGFPGAHLMNAYLEMSKAGGLYKSYSRTFVLDSFIEGNNIFLQTSGGFRTTQGVVKLCPSDFELGGYVVISPNYADAQQATLTWGDGSHLESIFIDTVGVYRLSVTDLWGCENHSQITILMDSSCAGPSVSSVINTDFTITPTATCQGTSVSLVNNTSDTSWSHGVNYTWIIPSSSSYMGYYLSSSEDANSFIYLDSPGTYYIKKIAEVLSTHRRFADSVLVTVYPKPVITITPTNPAFVCGIDSVILTASTDLYCPYPGWGWQTGYLGHFSAGSTVVATPVATRYVFYAQDSVHHCFSAKEVIIQPSVKPINGKTVICKSTTSNLYDSTLGGTWSSSNTSIATVGSTTGIVTGVNSGNVFITYTIPGGCYATTTVAIVTSIPQIVGPHFVCQHGAMTVSDSALGGTWSSSNVMVATVGTTEGERGYGGSGGFFAYGSIASVTGIAGGLSVTITYSIGGSCKSTLVMSVSPIALISGPTSLCQGQTITLSDATSGGTWYGFSANINVNASSGVVSGLYEGEGLVGYYMPNGCGSDYTVTVNPVAPITGSSSVCVGQTTTLTNAATGGMWSSSAPTIATIGSTGIVTGIAGGHTANISYTTGTGCRATKVVTVNALAPVSGPLSLCQGSSVTLTDAVSGGRWSNLTSALISVNSTTGVVTGLASGTAAIGYNLPNGCVSIFHLPINPIATITGASSVCVGRTTTLSAGISGGTWSSGSPTIATIGSTGVVTGMAGNLSANISYTFSTGCRATKVVTVNPNPTVASITGPSSVSISGSPITLTDATSGGTWISSNVHATIGSMTGIVIGVSAGITTITYTVSNLAGCTNFATKNVTIGAAPPSSDGGVIDTVNTTNVISITSVADVKLIPNPNKGDFTIIGKTSSSSDEDVFLEITELLGQGVVRSKILSDDGNIQQRVQLSSSIANGIYLLNLRSGNSNNVFRFVVEQ